MGEGRPGGGGAGLGGGGEGEGRAALKICAVRAHARSFLTQVSS